MFFFPLLNIAFLIILYRIQRSVFYFIAVIEIFLNVFGMYYIYTTFTREDNQFLYMLALTGTGAIIVFIGFFVAIFINRGQLYQDHE
jgi:hypothetical protein